jgi:L-ascorbate metabolism protein UlaG (beta-lactamase superfamily)
MIKVFQKGNQLKQDILSSKEKKEGLRIWWLAQSGFLVQWNGVHVLFDPYLSDSLTKKYAATDKPHVRMSELVIHPAELDMIDLVTSSHNHTDHLDAETLIPLFNANPNIKFIIPEANREFVSERCHIEGNWPIGLVSEQSFDLSKDVKITAIPAAHNDLKTDENGRHQFLGYIIYIGEYKIYHSGDTLWYDGLEEILKNYKPDIAFLPINGNKPERRVAGNLNFEEAAELGKRIDALVIPHHYDLFEFNTEDSQNFIDSCEAKGTKFKVMQIGEGIEV